MFELELCVVVASFVLLNKPIKSELLKISICVTFDKKHILYLCSLKSIKVLLLCKNHKEEEKNTCKVVGGGEIVKFRSHFSCGQCNKSKREY